MMDCSKILETSFPSVREPCLTWSTYGGQGSRLDPAILILSSQHQLVASWDTFPFLKVLHQAVATQVNMPRDCHMISTGILFPFRVHILALPHVVDRETLRMKGEEGMEKGLSN